LHREGEFLLLLCCFCPPPRLDARLELEVDRVAVAPADREAHEEARREVYEAEEGDEGRAVVGLLAEDVRAEGEEEALRGCAGGGGRRGSALLQEWSEAREEVWDALPFI